MDITIVIPARYASTRFPGKPLADLLGKPMIQWVYERCRDSRLARRVLVATDDGRIADAVRAFGGEVMMTRSDHPTGTDRLAEVAESLAGDLIINVQGDEPLIDPQSIDLAAEPLLEDESVAMGTLCTPLASADEFMNPNVVKVVCDGRGRALYFSRAPIPWPRDMAERMDEVLRVTPARRHIGLYVYRRDFLRRFPSLPRTPLEQLESLEQLRALEHGYAIMVRQVADHSLGVDTPEDLEQVRSLLAGKAEL
ncbi:3-deoxy-manno-octulosonate cytidylyltransferase (CMP-KDO synthetase) [Geothermobacter ehrlichii]|uniref:3-deoxy-manno-octulosonate cytidylyltransferase n=1 Tax=Geothermobacter ehrlichii TaxID=213224 RepID=A0A5D3WP77_9BACT|nr:3-deoxy-manno-octulosonate cytidylyltransferase [Geothermobacter ehrlichii]TYO99501.1 3-deoxy-manno-octulosonate cytidylyltransferase (CMP-KDO synthetase) [Geothermobacter ehrlichii]